MTKSIRFCAERPGQNAGQTAPAARETDRFSSKDALRKEQIREPLENGQRVLGKARTMERRSGLPNSPSRDLSERMLDSLSIEPSSDLPKNMSNDTSSYPSKGLLKDRSNRRTRAAHSRPRKNNGGRPLIRRWGMLLAAVLSLLFIAGLFWLGGEAAAGASAGLSLCGRVVVPSLFPFMIAALFISKSGLAEYSPPDSAELRSHIARHRGAAHPLCFTDEVMDHEFPERFKPVNIESYDGTIDPAVWIEDFLLHSHMARGDDLCAIKYLPLKLKGPAGHWLNSLPANSIGSWENLEDAFLDNFQGTYV